MGSFLLMLQWVLLLMLQCVPIFCDIEELMIRIIPNDVLLELQTGENLDTKPPLPLSGRHSLMEWPKRNQLTKSRDSSRKCKRLRLR